MEQILNYLKETYRPLSILVYGSCADGTREPDSDFDALLICEGCEKTHDVSEVGGVRLDVFVYPRSFFENGYDASELIQIHDAILVMDTDGLGTAVQKQVRASVEHMPPKSRAALQEELAWCQKMLLRAKRRDAEGAYRWHWVLTDSLEIYFDLIGRPYFGPKKSLRVLAEEFPQAHACYANALADYRYEALAAWIRHMERTWAETDRQTFADAQ